MEPPWGMIHARREAAGYAEELKNLKNRVDKALELLKKTKPNITQAIKLLEDNKP